jgi:hypothetical protein
MPEMKMKMRQSPPNKKGPEPEEQYVLIVGQSLDKLRDFLKRELANVPLLDFVDAISAAKIYDGKIKLIIFDVSSYDRGFRDYCVSRLREKLGQNIPVIFVSTKLMSVIDLVTAEMKSGYRIFYIHTPEGKKEVLELVKNLLQKMEGMNSNDRKRT